VVDKRKPWQRVYKLIVNHLRSITGLIKLAKSYLIDKVDKEYVKQTTVIPTLKIYNSNGNDNDI